jgi:hypothetical protein
MRGRVSAVGVVVACFVAMATAGNATADIITTADPSPGADLQNVLFDEPILETGLPLSVTPPASAAREAAFHGFDFSTFHPAAPVFLFFTEFLGNLPAGTPGSTTGNASDQLGGGESLGLPAGPGENFFDETPNAPPLLSQDGATSTTDVNGDFQALQVPEPTSALLLALGLLGLAGYFGRRRL